MAAGTPLTKITLGAALRRGPEHCYQGTAPPGRGRPSRDRAELGNIPGEEIAQQVAIPQERRTDISSSEAPFCRIGRPCRRGYKCLTQ